MPVVVRNMINSYFLPKFRFGPRFTLGLLVSLTVLFVYVGNVVRFGMLQKASIENVMNVDGGVAFDLGMWIYKPKEYRPDSDVVRKLRSIFGDNFFGHVREVAFLSPLKQNASISYAKAFPKISHLSLRDHEIIEETIRKIAEIDQLKSLGFSRCSFDNGALGKFNLLSNIESITLIQPLADNQDQILKRISEDMDLREVQLFSFQLDGINLRHLKNLPNLELLRLNSVRINDDDLQWMANNLALKTIVLEAIPNITDKGLDHLKNMKSLERLMVVDCPITPAGIAAIKNALPWCEVYHIDTASELSQ